MSFEIPGRVLAGTWLVLLFVCGSVQADEEVDVTKRWSVEFDSQRLMDMAGVMVTQTDMDAYLQRIPAERRAPFLASVERLSEALTNIVLVQGFRPLAEQEGLLDDPVTQARLYHALGREVREIYQEWYLESIELDDYTLRAREIYLTDPERFRRPETLDFHHILVVAGEQRSEVDAMARVVEVHEKLRNGADFAEIAVEYSDDPSVSENDGYFEGVEPGGLLQQVAAVLGRAEMGEVAAPVRSPYGWHIVVLEAVNEGSIPEWEAVSDRANRMAREQHRTEAFERLLRDLQEGGYEFAEGSIAALLTRYGVAGEDDQPTEDRIGPLLFDKD